MKATTLGTILCSAGAALFAGCAPALAADQSPLTAKATLTTTDGTTAGVVSFQETPNGVIVSGTLENLPVGKHGFHIHETGECEGDFSSAGGHYAPRGHDHGLNNEAGFHAGDLPNIYVADTGLAQFDHFAPQITLSDGEATLADADGSAVIVHEKGDRYLAEAGAGARLACGVIEMQ